MPDVVRRRIPDDVAFKTKLDLAIELITTAVEDKIPGEVVLADCFYGVSSDLRNVIRIYGFDFGVAVNAVTRVWLLNAIGRRRGEPVGAQQLGVDLGRKAFRRITWREERRARES